MSQYVNTEADRVTSLLASCWGWGLLSKRKRRYLPLRVLMQFQDWKSLRGIFSRVPTTSPHGACVPPHVKTWPFTRWRVAAELLLNYCIPRSPKFQSNLHSYPPFMGPYRFVPSLGSSNKSSCCTQSGHINTYLLSLYHIAVGTPQPHLESRTLKLVCTGISTASLYTCMSWR